MSLLIVDQRTRTCLSTYLFDPVNVMKKKTTEDIVYTLCCRFLFFSSIADLVYKEFTLKMALFIWWLFCNIGC